MIAAASGVGFGIWAHVRAFPGPIQGLIVLAAATLGMGLVSIVLSVRNQIRQEEAGSGPGELSLLSVKMYSHFPENVYHLGELLIETVLRSEYQRAVHVKFVRWEDHPITFPPIPRIEFFDFLGLMPGELVYEGRGQRGPSDRVVSPREVIKVEIEVRHTIMSKVPDTSILIGTLVLSVDGKEVSFALMHKPVAQKIN